MRSKFLLTVLCASISLASMGADLKMQMASAFTGFAPNNGELVVAVTIRNNGPDARGVLHASTESFDMDYPVDLPRGAVKKLLTYPFSMYGSEVHYSLSTNRGDISGTYRNLLGSNYGAHSVLVVSQDEGDMGFLRAGAKNATQLSDCYVRPEEAPDRGIAYNQVCCVVLGAGAERLPDSAVQALHRYVAAGGSILFLGGASAPALTDRRWADIAPVAAGSPVTIQRSASYSDVQGAFTILDSKPDPNSSTRIEDGHVMAARRYVGLGKTLFVAFNPFETPFTRWSRRKAFITNLIRPFDFDQTSNFLARFRTASGGGTGTLTYYGSTAGAPPPVSVYQDNTERDPFSTQLPPVEKVFWILLCYFVVIIPINFLLLKKLKKGELAWLTAPLISVSFAGAFFAAAKDLYSAKMSTATQGLLIAMPSSEESLFLGRSQIFFPRGGTYDLRMRDLETVGNVASDEYAYYGYRRDSQFQGLNAVDDGAVHLNNMDVNNLAFREVSYAQTVQGPWLSVQVDKEEGSPKLRVQNRSPYTLTGVSALVSGAAYGNATLAPGEQTTIPIPSANSAASKPGQGSEVGLSQFSADTKQIILKMVVLKAPVGPKIGSIVPDRQQVTLAYFTGIRHGQVPF